MSNVDIIVKAVSDRLDLMQEFTADRFARLELQIGGVVESINGNGKPGLKSRVQAIEADIIAEKDRHAKEDKKVDDTGKERRDFRRSMILLAAGWLFTTGLTLWNTFITH